MDLTTDTLPPTPEPTAPQHSQASLGGHSISSGDENDVRLSSRKRKKQKAKQKRLDFARSSPASQRGVNTAQPVRAGFFGTQNYVNLDSSGGSSDENASLPKAPPPKKRKTRNSSPPVVEQSADIHLASDNFVELGDGGDGGDASDDDDDMLPTTPAARRRRQGLPASQKVASDRESSPFIVDDVEEDSDDVIVMGSRKRQLSSKKRHLSESAEEPSSDGVTVSRSRKRLRRTKEPKITEEERQEIEEDLQDLASSGSDTEVRLQQPRKQSARKTAREQALAKLKAKRDGGGAIAGEDEAGDEDDDQSQTFEDQIYQGVGSSDGLDDEDKDQLVPRTTSRRMFNKDEEDDSFVVEDDDADLGAPAGLPLEFTRYAAMKPKELFKYAVEWMVQKKINPAFEMTDEMYILAFRKLDDFVKGLAGSKFTSSAWTQDFTFAMQARPEIQAFSLDRTGEHFMRDKCDACNRSGHPATFEVLFQGKPYNPQSLEEVAPTNDFSSESENDSDSDSEKAANRDANYDSKGHKILPEDTVFYLGKFCMRNAETAHALHHWRFHLYEWVVEYLEAAGYNTPANIVKRDKWSTDKRRKYSNKIVDAMHADGKIKALYRDFQNQVNTARDSVQSGRWLSSPP